MTSFVAGPPGGGLAGEPPGCSFWDIRMPKVELEMNWGGGGQQTKALGQVLWVQMRKWCLLLTPAYVPFCISIGPSLGSLRLIFSGSRHLLLSSSRFPTPSVTLSPAAVVVVIRELYFFQKVSSWSTLAIALKIHIGPNLYQSGLWCF